jgi:hypothetical protein
MSHPNDDQLLLYSYAELPADDSAAVEQHLAQCAECRARFTAIEESRVAVELAAPKPAGSRRRLAWLALPLAAAIGAFIVMRQPAEPAPAEKAPWESHLSGSATAGYVAGGAEFHYIDQQLTSLEQGSSRELPQP